jgi:hypothetical protein
MGSTDTQTPTALLWKQPKFGVDHFKLYQEDSLNAEIYRTRLLSDTTIGKVAGCTWTFNRKGWLQDQVEAVESESKKRVAIFQFDWLKNGTLTLSNGRTFKWYRTKTFANTYALAESGQEGFLEIEHGWHWFKQRAWVTAYFPPGDPDLPLLLCLTMVLVYCINQDTAVAAATSVAGFG